MNISLPIFSHPAYKCSSGVCVPGTFKYGVVEYWSLSIADTTGTQLCVLYREVSLIHRYRFVHSSMYLGLQTVSSLERCPLFILSFIESFHCTPSIYGTCMR